MDEVRGTKEDGTLNGALKWINRRNMERPKSKGRKE
jgi:hypothetical protein